MPSTPNEDTPRSPPVTLSYASAGIASRDADNLVTIRKCNDSNEAAVLVNALETAGIHAVAANQNVNNLGIHMSSLVPVEIQVRKEESERAGEVLRLATTDDVEPADDQPENLPALEEGGAPVELAEAARFDNIRRLREAALLLESSHIRPVSPRLVLRTEENAGSGNRFILRVPVADVERAEEILQDFDDDTDEDELHCPKCGSWRIHPVWQPGATIKWFLRMGDKPVEQKDCLQCKYRGPTSEFERAT